MKRISLVKEAERLNVPLDVVLKSQKKLLRERKVQGIIDIDNNEVVTYTPEEFDEIVELLNEKSMLFKDLAKKYDLTTAQAKLLVDDLLTRNKVSGLIKNNEFISSKNLEVLIKSHLENSADLTPRNTAQELDVPAEKVREVATRLENQMYQTVIPYSNVPVVTLSDELGLSESLTIALLKRLIAKERIVASIDMVNKIVKIDKSAKKNETELPTSYIPEYIRKKNLPRQMPSNGWYLVPLFFGLIGGILGYIAVKDDDNDMANTLLLLGFISSVVSIIIGWTFWARYWYFLF